MKARGLMALIALWLLGACKAGGFPESPSATPSPLPLPTYPTVATWTQTTPLDGLAANVTIDRTANALAQDNVGTVQIRFTGSATGITFVTLNITNVGGYTFTDTFDAVELSTAISTPGPASTTLLTKTKPGSDGISTVALTTLDTTTSGFNYMVLGSWEYERIATPASAVGSGFVAGPATRSADIPLSGPPATYSGVMFGRYADGNTIASVTAQAGATADFVTRQVTFFTTNTQIAGVPNTDLNLGGTLSYPLATNSLTGTLSTIHLVPGDRLTGLSEARFYGPAAAELGGTFFVQGGQGGGQQMTGSFGLKQ